MEEKKSEKLFSFSILLQQIGLFFAGVGVGGIIVYRESYSDIAFSIATAIGLGLALTGSVVLIFFDRITGYKEIKFLMTDEL